jgi:hypothetical protein
MSGGVALAKIKRPDMILSGQQNSLFFSLFPPLFYNRPFIKSQRPLRVYITPLLLLLFILLQRETSMLCTKNTSRTFERKDLLSVVVASAHSSMRRRRGRLPSAPNCCGHRTWITYSAVVSDIRPRDFRIPPYQRSY